MNRQELRKQIKQVDACMRPLEPEDVAAWESIKDFVQVASTPPEAMRDEHGDLVLFVRREPDGRVTDILWTISQEERERYTIKALKSHIAELEGKLKECYCYTPEHISELFPPPTRPAPPMPAYKVGPVACQQRMKEAGQPYPRTCPSCGLGPCNRRDA